MLTRVPPQHGPILGLMDTNVICENAMVSFSLAPMSLNDRYCTLVSTFLGQSSNGLSLCPNPPLPNVYNCPSLSTKNVQYFPVYIWHISGSSNLLMSYLTNSNSRLDWVSSKPSWPYTFKPTVNTRPLDRITVCANPAMTESICCIPLPLDSSENMKDTGVGVNTYLTFLSLPSPNCPIRPSPHAYSLPSSDTASEWKLPAQICVICTFGLKKCDMNFGLPTYLMSLPSPNCPSDPWPTLYTS